MKKFIILIFVLSCLSIFSQPSRQDYSFTENMGQIKDDKGKSHSEILFTGQGEDYSIYLRKNGWSYILKAYDSVSYQTQRVDIDFENANSDFKLERLNQLPGYDNFPVRNNESINHVYSFSEVVYKDVYKGIDLRFYYDKGNLRYDYIVHPGSDPNQLLMTIKYSDNPTINNEDGINIPTMLGEIRKEKPYAYQPDSLQKIEIECNYKLNGNKLSFRTEKYNNSKELIIDPVSIIWGKLRRMKSLFNGDFLGVLLNERYYYSFATSTKNIKRLKDNSTILLSNSATDNEFINEAFGSIKDKLHFEFFKYSLLPTVLSKYDSNGNKEWTVSIYEKHNNLISWDANDSVIVVYSHSYLYYDTLTENYTKNTVFAAVYDMKGTLLHRFELSKPNGIVELIHPQQDHNLFNGGMKWIDNYAYSNYFSRSNSIDILSYENTLKLDSSHISLIALGRYSENDDSTYNSSLFLQKYSLNGNLQYSKELKHNKIVLRNNSLIFDSSSFDASNLTADIITINYLNDGSYFVIRNNISNKELSMQVKSIFESYFEFYDKYGNLTSKSSEYNDFRFLIEKCFAMSNYDTTTKYHYLNWTSFKIDSNKNIFTILHFFSNDLFLKKYKNLIKKNPYSPNYKSREPYLLKFDSTGKLLWISQFFSFPENFTISTGLYHVLINKNDSLCSKYDTNPGYFENIGNLPDRFVHDSYRTPMNTGLELIITQDSVGNIFIPRIIDSCEYRIQSSSRKLVIIKIDPEGNVVWQDTSALNFRFKFKTDSLWSSLMRIKSASITGNTLYLDYFVSNLQGVKPAKDADKYEFSGVYPHPDISNIVGQPERPFDNIDVLYDLLFLKFNINEKDLVQIGDKDLTPIDTAIYDTTCVGSSTIFKLNVTNKWHSKMIFDAPLIEGEGFSITPSGTFTLDSGKSKEFVITFSPTEFKTYDAKITFKQNSIGAFSNTVNLKGFTKATLLKSDSVWDLGTILINNTASGTFKLYNTGNIGSWFWGIKGLPAEYKQILPIDSSSFIKPYDSLEFKLEFTPAKEGIFEYKYKFITSTGCPDTCEITIRGRAVTESIEISSGSINYGYLYSCETKTDTLLIENVANNPLTYKSVDLTGLNSDNFTIIEKPNDGAVMLRGFPLKFIIKFKPSGNYGSKQAELKINTSEKNITCPLSGEYSEIKFSANDIEMGYKSINVAYDTTIKITNSTKDMFALKQAIPDDSRITVMTSLPLDIASMESKDLAIQIKSETKDDLNTKIKLAFSGRCESDINANIYCKFDSAAAETAGIDFGKVPYCEDRTDSISITNTSKVPFKIIDIQFSEIDGRFELIGNPVYPLEIQAGETYKVGIKYTADTKQVSENNAKLSVKMEMNGKEQISEILIKGSRIVPDLNYESIINLGQFKPSEVKNSNIEISNNSEDINITDIKITDNTNFKILDYPKNIVNNTKGNINISFSAEIIGKYVSEMTLYFKLGECSDSIKISMNAEVQRLMTIWANHDTADAGISGFYVPVYAKTDAGANIAGTGFSLNIKYLPEIYYSVTSEDAVITNKTRDGSYEIARIDGKFPKFQDSTEILFHLKGDILFSTIKTTPIEIEYINSEKSLAVTTQTGSLTLKPICVNNFRGIKSYKPASMSVNPHPLNENSKINIISENRGLHVLELYSVSGEKYEIASWTQNSSESITRELSIDKNKFPSGVYLLNLRMEWSQVQEVILIVE